MLLNLQVHKYDQDIYPHIKNGVIIDTSVFLTIVDGIVIKRFSNKKSSEFEKILQFLDILKINNRWSKFFITPHILTEVCNNIRNTYSKRCDFAEIVNAVMPLIAGMEDRSVTKGEILRYINFKKPVLEIGDISIYVIADDFAQKDSKIAILATDYGFSKKYEYNKYVMVLDYRSNILNLL